MQEAMVFLKEKQVADFEILEQAIACMGHSNSLKGQQVWEALERLRGTVHQYEISKKENLFSVYEYGQLQEMLMNGKEGFFHILEGIFYRAERNRNIKVYEMQAGFQKIFCSLYEDILDKYSYADLYLEREELFVPEGSAGDSTDALYGMTSEIAKKMYTLLKKFRLATDSELIQGVAGYTWENVEQDISLEKIAGVFFVNKTYLSHLFKQETGRNFVNFFTEIRMLRSRVLLRHHSKIYECALQLGYEDAEYFSKVFKGYYGCKPTEYMARQQGGAFCYGSRTARRLQEQEV